ncbi:hypothetical protein GWK47_045076 [Chionoecetes opilio]|uniref:Uncharacterized protein n=1 Tax=Chionoecetes opilio TaxID=41210 RepID=A0A8J4YD98_CHIOP|nr:hypothetical protein GWK47_045076 [Chionoecetes opilio]
MFRHTVVTLLLSVAGRTSESARSKQSQVLDGGHSNDLMLSEDSEEEEQGNGSGRGSGGRPSASGPAYGTPSGHHQSSGSANNNNNNSMVPLSPISSPKSSDESSTSEDSSDDSEVSSNNSTDDEQVDVSPKHQDNNSDADAWRLGNFITAKKTNSPMSAGAAGAGQQRTDDQPQVEAKGALPPPPRERAERKASKNSSSGGSHHGRGQEGRWAKPDKLYEDSSDEGSPHPRPTPRVSAEVRQTPKHGREPPGRTRLPKAKAPPPHQYPDSDSDSDAPPPRKSQPPAKAAPQDTDKSPRVSAAPVAREAPKKIPRKRSDSRKGSHSGAKSEGSRGRPRRPREFKSQETVVDSDSDQSVDVVNSSPEKVVGRGTPSRTPRETSRSMASPLKAPTASPVSPRLPPPPTKAKRPATTGLGTSLGSDSPASKSEDEADTPGQGSSQRAEAARASSSSSSSSKGALVSRAFGAAAKKAIRDQEAAEAKKVKGEARRPSGGNRRDRSDKGVRGRAAAEASAAAAPCPAFSPGGRAGKSPVVSAEPKVPIPQVQFVDGYPRLTCTIALSFIDKVPKPSVGGAPHGVNAVKSEVKSEVKCEVKSEVKEEEEEDEEEEEEEERKAVLDNRTKEGKGKRKASHPGTKTAEDESKRKIISSIFGNVKRQDHESDDDKVKREIKKEEEESEEERGGRSSSLRPTVTVKQ